MKKLYVLRLTAAIQIALSFFMLIPAGIAAYDGHWHVVRYFFMSIGLVWLLAGPFLFFTRKQKTRVITHRDGFFFVTTSWILASVFGALPLYFSESFITFTDSFFEIMSGFTTTGATVLANIEALPRGLLFWRSLTHWLGGMGIVVMLVALLPLMGTGGTRLLGAEAPGPQVDKLTPRIADNAKVLWLTYIVLSLIEASLLFAGGMSVFDALTHTFGSMATGGFSPKAASLGHYNSVYFETVITVFMLLAGINFALFYKMLQKKFSEVFRDEELRVYLLIFFGAAGLITLNLFFQGGAAGIGEAFRLASFQTASILTTTGFSTADYELWPAFSRMVLFLLMFVGGCAGSTGGGIKVTRIITMVKLGLNNIKYMLHPRGVFTIKLSRTTVKKERIYSISGFFALYLFTLAVVSLVVASSGAGIVTSISTALATLGNIALGFGGIGPSGNYAFFPGYVKWTLSFAMLAGRLELFTVFALMTRAFWKR